MFGFSKWERFSKKVDQLFSQHQVDERLIVMQLIERFKITNKKDLIIALEQAMAGHTGKDNPFAVPRIDAGIGLLRHFQNAIDKVKESDLS